MEKYQSKINAIVTDFALKISSEDNKFDITDIALRN
jgi:hypothetical protein